MTGLGGVKVGILTVSDRCARGEQDDVSGARIAAWCGERGYTVAERATVPDETAAIVPLLAAWMDGAVDLVVTTGGTGLAPRDVTPEATRAVIEREVPGIAEEIRRVGAEATPYAALSRGIAGTRSGSLVVNLPGSPSGVDDGLGVLLPIVEHAIALSRGTDASHTPPEVAS